MIDCAQVCQARVSSPPSTLKRDVRLARGKLKALRLQLTYHVRTHGFKREKPLFEAFRATEVLINKRVEPALNVGSSLADYNSALQALDIAFVAFYTDDDRKYSTLVKMRAAAEATSAKPWHVRLVAAIPGSARRVLRTITGAFVVFGVWWFIDVVREKPFDLVQAIIICGALAAIYELLDKRDREIFSDTKE